MKGLLVSHCNLWSSHYKPINRPYQERNKYYPKFSSPSPSLYFISITTRLTLLQETISNLKNNNIIKFLHV